MRNSIVLTMVLLAGAAGATPRTAAATRSQFVPDSIKIAHRFVFAAYPDFASLVAQRVVTLNVSTFKDGRVTIEAVAPSTTSRTGTVSVLFSTMYVDTAGLVVSHTAAGSALRGLDNSQLSMALIANPGWTDRDAAEWLRRRAPGVTAAALTARLSNGSTTALKAFLGSGIVFGEPTLLWRSDVAERGGRAPFRTKPVWTVQASGFLPNGRSSAYRLEFEPFEGHLVGILRE